jgi:hypothetical protein
MTPFMIFSLKGCDLMGSFKIDPSNLLKGLSDLDQRKYKAIDRYADTAGKKLEAEAKKDAPWTDRTSLARQTIKGGKEWESEKCHVYVAGNTDYFPYLEFDNEKKYAILYPTLKKLEYEIIQGMNKILEK